METCIDCGKKIPGEETFIPLIKRRTIGMSEMGYYYCKECAEELAKEYREISKKIDSSINTFYYEKHETDNNK